MSKYCNRSFGYTSRARPAETVAVSPATGPSTSASGSRSIGWTVSPRPSSAVTSAADGTPSSRTMARVRPGPSSSSRSRPGWVRRRVVRDGSSLSGAAEALGPVSPAPVPTRAATQVRATVVRRIGMGCCSLRLVSPGRTPQRRQGYAYARRVRSSTSPSARCCSRSSAPWRSPHRRRGPGAVPPAATSTAGWAGGPASGARRGSSRADRLVHPGRRLRASAGSTVPDPADELNSSPHRHHWNLSSSTGQPSQSSNKAWEKSLLDVRGTAGDATSRGIVARSTRRCAADGYEAVEFDNLDSYTRSRRSLTRGQALAFARLRRRGRRARRRARRRSEEHRRPRRHHARVRLRRLRGVRAVERVSPLRRPLRRPGGDGRVPPSRLPPGLRTVRRHARHRAARPRPAGVRAPGTADS